MLKYRLLGSIFRTSNLEGLLYGLIICIYNKFFKMLVLPVQCYVVVQSLSCVWLFVTPLFEACCSMPGFPSLSPRVCSNSHPLSWWCHPTISSSVTTVSFCLQSFRLMQFFASDGQSIGVSASASVLPVNIQDWFPLGLTGWISLQSKWLSVVLSITTVQKHRFLRAQLSLWSNSHIHTWLEKQ